MFRRIWFSCPVLAATSFLAFASFASAIDVWVDFTSDFHDGANGGPNGTADWIEELDQAAADAGVPSFTPTERAQIENTILTDLATVFADYELNFVTSQPAGIHDVIYMARDDDHPDVSSTNLGSSPVDIGNQDTNGYTNQNGNPSGVPKVTAANFERFIESNNPRFEQIDEISTALAGTTAHEYGHSIGLLHHYVYSAVGITPANYNDTQSIQNQHIMATGTTGISETERQMKRDLSPFSRVMLDITGGSQASPTEENISLVQGGIVSDRSENISGDAGDSIGSAQLLSFQVGPTSGVPISFVEADLDGSSSDIDIFSFTTGVDAILNTHVFSERLDLGSVEFDPVLELLDDTGSVLFSADDIGWDDDVYNDLSTPEDEEDDPFLVNIPIDAGTYYLRVTPATTDVSDTPNVGDNYWLVTSLDFVTPPLIGDFNGDGLVNSADYVTWRDNLGGSESVLLGAGDNSGVVDEADYALWRDNFGAVAPVLELTSAVPEPSASLLILMALACWHTSSFRSRTCTPEGTGI